MQKIILCTSSPRRIRLFELFFSDFSCLSPLCNEISFNNNPRKTVLINSQSKVEWGINELDCKKQKSTKTALLIVSADTVVFYKNQILNKPQGYDNALFMLKQLNGTTHCVYTGVSVYNSINNTFVSFYDKSTVTFYKHSEKTLEKYLKYEHFLDAAGSYKIQGLGIALIKHISGSYTNVLGFPIEKFYKYYTTLTKYLS